MNTKQKFYIVTQGCKVNQYESQAIRESWLQHNYTETDKLQQADIILINSCAVTQRAVQDLFRLIRRFYKQSQAEIVITGCAAQILQTELQQEPGVTQIIPQQKKADLFSAHPGIKGYYRARAVVKIQDGCSHGCTYCIIPKTRGASVSRSKSEIIAEVQRLFEAGICEVSLCGINLRQFGRDLNPSCDFWDLLAELEDKLQKWQGLRRLRLSSLEPADLTDKALAVLANSRLICPHLHISLQSASPEVLKRMGRGHYRASTVQDFISKLNKFWPTFALGADILVGFPAESEEDFELTLDFCQQTPLTYAHVFPFSARPGTPAADFTSQVPVHIRHDRAKQIRNLIMDKKDLFLKNLSRQKELEIVPENSHKGMCQFYVECYLLPDQQACIQQKINTVHPQKIEKGKLMVSL